MSTTMIGASQSTLMFVGPSNIPRRPPSHSSHNASPASRHPAANASTVVCNSTAWASVRGQHRGRHIRQRRRPALPVGGGGCGPVGDDEPRLLLRSQVTFQVGGDQPGQGSSDVVGVVGVEGVDPLRAAGFEGDDRPAELTRRAAGIRLWGRSRPLCARTRRCARSATSQTLTCPARSDPPPPCWHSSPPHGGTAPRGQR